MTRNRFYSARKAFLDVRRLLAGGLAVFAIGASLGTSHPVLAQGAGDLVVAPTRVVFEGRTRSAQLGLVNKGSETATYRISIINMRMDENGNMTEIAKPEGGQQFADRLFRYSPRQVDLEPGASQAIRLLLRKPKDLPDGEYRSHILMRAIPKDSGESVEQAADTQGGAAVRLIPIFGIAIPVIVRHGDVNYSVAVENPVIVPPTEEGQLNRVRFSLVRSGNRSSFGDLAAKLNVGGKEIVLSQIKRLAVYTPNQSRTVEMALRIPDGVSLSGNKLTISYHQIADEGGKLLGETTISIP